jgi:hypothetical protein
MTQESLPSLRLKIRLSATLFGFYSSVIQINMHYYSFITNLLYLKNNMHGSKSRTKSTQIPMHYFTLKKENRHLVRCSTPKLAASSPPTNWPYALPEWLSTRPLNRKIVPPILHFVLRTEKYMQTGLYLYAEMHVKERGSIISE